MPRLSRRTLLKSGLAASVGGAALMALPAHAQASRARAVSGGRERLLLDPNWRFAFGHASDPAQDFGLGTGSDWESAGYTLGPGLRLVDAIA